MQIGEILFSEDGKDYSIEIEVHKDEVYVLGCSCETPPTTSPTTWFVDDIILVHKGYIDDLIGLLYQAKECFEKGEE